MLVYVFVNIKSGDRLHTVKSNGSLELTKGEHIWIDSSLYVMVDRPKLHIFKESNLNVYFVDLAELKTDKTHLEHVNELKGSISDLIRDASIGKVLED